MKPGGPYRRSTVPRPRHTRSSRSKPAKWSMCACVTKMSVRRRSLRGASTPTSPRSKSSARFSNLKPMYSAGSPKTPFTSPAMAMGRIRRLARAALSAEYAADARAGDAVHREQARRAQHDEDHAQGGGLALRARDVEGEDAERHHLPAAQREEDRRRRFLDRGDEGEQR